VNEFQKAIAAADPEQRDAAVRVLRALIEMLGGHR